MNQQKTVSIQDRMRNKAQEGFAEVEYQIDKFVDNNYKSSFNMYKYLKQLGYSGKVVAFMKGRCESELYELENKEGCPQLEEGFSHLTKAQKKRFIKFLQDIENDIVKFVDEYKPVRKVRIKTPKQLVKRLPYLDRYKGFQSADPEEIIRARMLYTYNTSSKKLTKFETFGGLSVKGSRITDYNVCQEKTLTDEKLLDRLYKGGNIIAKSFMDEIPRSKLKDGNDLLTKNTLLIKVIK